MVAPSITIFSFFYIIKHKKFFLGLLYLIFCYILFKNFSTTFFFGTILSISFIVLLTVKNIKTKVAISYILLLLILSLVIFQTSISESIKSKIPKFKIQNIDKIQKKNHDKEDIINTNRYDLDKYKLNLSTEVYIKSMITSYEIFN